MVAPGLSLSQAAFNIQTLGRALQAVPPYALGYNPYTSAVTGAYAYPTSVGYGSGYPAMMYSSGYPDVSMSDYPSGTTSNNSPSGYGAIENRKGGTVSESKLDWPLALRILPPSLETRPLREQIDAAMAQVQAEAAKGKVDAGLVKEANRAVDQLRTRWDDKADFLPTSQQAKTDAEQFLKKLKETLKNKE